MRRLLLLVLAAGCSSSASSSSRASSDDPAPPPASFATYDAGATPGGPGAGAHFGFGRAPSDSLLRALDTDIGRDGTTLPPGRGLVAEGATLYAAQCATCHGAKGEGVAPNPALIGRDSSTSDFGFGSDPKLVKTIGNYWPHATTVFDYIKRAMPLNAPGSLTDPQVYALTAWLLSQNGLLDEAGSLDAATLRAVQMPARARFVADDRTGGPEPK